MSRTHHHSENWNRAHPCHRDALPDRYWASTTPSWWVTLFMHRPGRREDRQLIHLIMTEQVDVEEAVFARTGNHKPHEYYW